MSSFSSASLFPLWGISLSLFTAVPQLRDGRPSARWRISLTGAPPGAALRWRLAQPSSYVKGT